MLWADLNLSTYYALQSVLLNSLEQAFKQWDILASNPFADIMHQLHLHKPLVLQIDNWYLAKHKEKKFWYLRWGRSWVWPRWSFGTLILADIWRVWRHQGLISGILVEPWDDPKNLRHRVSGLSDRDAEGITRDGLHFVLFYFIYFYLCWQL